MTPDEQEIRQLVATWMEASQTGEVETVLSLMSEDVVFLVPGQPPMRKEEFATAMRAQAATEGLKFEGHSQIQEVQVCGELAFLWTRLAVSITPPGETEPFHREGHTLSVLKKEQGRWLLARDANLLTTVD